MYDKHQLSLQSCFTAKDVQDWDAQRVTVGLYACRFSDG